MFNKSLHDCGAVDLVTLDSLFAEQATRCAARPAWDEGGAVPLPGSANVHLPVGATGLRRIRGDALFACMWERRS